MYHLSKMKTGGICYERYYPGRWLRDKIVPADKGDQ